MTAGASGCMLMQTLTKGHHEACLLTATFTFRASRWIADEPENRNGEDENGIEAFIEELQKTFRNESTEDTSYSIVKDCADENRIVITKEVERLASKINYIGENYMDSWQKYKKIQQDLAHSVSGQMESCGLNDWAVLLQVVDSAIGQQMLSIYQNEIVYDFLNE